MFQWTQKIEQFVEKYFHIYERYVPTAALIWGLLWDSLTLHRPDSLFSNATVAGYLALVACAIIVLNVRRARLGHEPSLILLAFIQFAFGNLTSALLVLYVKSGTFVGSAIFIGVLATLLIGNEFIRDRYRKIRVLVGIWYGLLLAYCIIIVPILLGQIGDTIFLLSLLLSLVMVSIFLAALYAIASRAMLEQLFQTIGYVGAIAILFTIFYFSGVIPPAPLMPRQIGVYHSVTRTAAGDYEATYEEPHWYEFFADTARTYTLVGDSKKAYCASSVFAPANLETPIFHRWEYFDAQQNDWVSVAHIPFSIRGGREKGFRGYSEISVLTPGKWRCNVETERGALIGRFAFTVVRALDAPPLSQTTF
ncbi:DUF2914 domain-containing protein [Candidatus Kaiserbacteria bacterium]|nr:DUF2914 domain-containing protein [Candidatus Kaiserbacteria bacterium]